jgi:ankyrin repeat protein
MDRLPVELHFKTLDQYFDPLRPFTHADLCGIRKYALLSRLHHDIVSEWIRSRQRCWYFGQLKEQFLLWDDRPQARLRSQDPGDPPQIGEPDILTGAIRDHCIQCYHLLCDQFDFPALGFNNFGWSFLGIALTVRCDEIALDIANRPDSLRQITGPVNVKPPVSPMNIALACQTGDRTVWKPIYDRIPPECARQNLWLWFTPHDQALLCQNATLELAERLLQDRCNIAAGFHNITGDTSWHYGIENPCGIPFMEFLLCNQVSHVRKDQANTNGETPLRKAVRSNRLEMARWLINNHADTQHDRALLCQNSTLQLAEQLHQYGCNIADGVDSFTGDTSWHYGIENPCGIPFMQFLLRNQVSHDSKDQPNNNSETPLMKAVCSNRLEIVELLINNGADAKRAGLGGTTAAHLAAGLQTDESIKMLEILRPPHADVDAGHQNTVGTILHALVDGVRSAESQLSNLGYGERRRLRRQYRNRVYKKYREISQKYKPNRALTNEAGLTAVQYALSFGLRDLATHINREAYKTRSSTR